MSSDDLRMSPIETAPVPMPLLNGDALAEALSVVGPGHEDFPCSEMLDVHVEHDGDGLKGPIPDGAVVAPVTVEWTWTEDGPVQRARATLTGEARGGVLHVHAIEISLDDPVS